MVSVSLRELLKRFCVNDVLFIIEIFISLSGRFLVATSALHAGMPLIPWDLTCSYASLLVEDDLVLGGKCVKGHLYWFRSFPVSCTGVLCLGHGVGVSRKQSAPGDQRELYLMGWGQQLFHGILLPRSGHCKEPLQEPASSGLASTHGMGWS